MSGVSPLTISLILWAVITTVFIGLVIYRSLVAMKEDDQLFLSAAEAGLEEEQRQVLARIQRITPYTKGFGFASAGLLMLAGSIWLYEGLTRFGMP
jgi:hypothetical protein